MNHSFDKMESAEGDLSYLKHIFSLRFQVISLLAISIVAAVFIVLVVGVSVFVDDKSSHLMEATQSQVESAAHSIESQVKKVLLMTRVMHGLVRANDKESIHKIYEESSQSVHMKRMLILNMNHDGVFKVHSSFGDEDHSMIHTLDQLGWDGHRFLNDPVLVGKSLNGDLAVGTLVTSADGSGTVFLSLMDPDIHAKHGDLQVIVVDSLGDPLQGGLSRLSGMTRTQLMEVLKPLSDERVSNGIRKWASDQETYWVAYHRLQYKEFSVVGMMSEKHALMPVKGLVLRSSILGMSILFIAIGFSLLFLKRISDGLQAMMAITNKICAGEFTYRLETRGNQEDEIGRLATSFNLMAGKIDDLMAGAVKQVEQRYEKEATDLVRNYLVPSNSIQNSKVSCAGSSLVSSPYGGDWWYCDQLRDHVVFFCGKIDGSGVSAALLTGFIRGVLSTLCGASKALTIEAPDLKYFVGQINSVLHIFGRGKVRVSAVLAKLDTRTGVVELVNASHTPPILMKAGEEKSPEQPHNLSPLQLRKHTPLGASAQMRIESDTIQLKAGEKIFWYSAGLMSAQNSQGEMLNTESVMSLFSLVSNDPSAQAGTIAEEIGKKVRDFLGELGENPTEDITVAVMSIPQNAEFQNRVEEGEPAA